MTPNEIREKYLSFMAKNGHAIVPSSALVPENDPTTLFTGSGMQPLVPYLLGKDHPNGSRLVDSQKCFRSMDIEEVGDNRHTTFFEMLGNWSLGDYFKDEQLTWFFEFLTGEVGLDAKRLYVTAFIGDEKNNVPKDEKSVAIWKELFKKKGIDAKAVEIGSEENGYTVGMQDGRIFYYDAKKNWWSRSGTPDKMPVGEPGGPDSEVFYDFGTPHDPTWGKECHPNCDCGRFLEIGNSVFMQYIKNADGTFALLPKQNVDFGGGLERITAAANGDSDVFRVDVLNTIVTKLEELTKQSYTNPDFTKAFRVIADHIRAAVFLIADGVLPSNKDQGYFVRRLIRRAVFALSKFKLERDEFISIGYLAHIVADQYMKQYPQLKTSVNEISSVLTEEETAFRIALERGQKEVDKSIAETPVGGMISGVRASTLFTTFGFPIEMVTEMARAQGRDVDVEAVRIEMSKHRDDSRAGSEQKFKGGLADASEATTRLHTAHHLLLKALQKVLGDHVHQRGSNITSERLRIDFSHGEKMTDEQKKEVERIVNEEISAELPVIHSIMPKDDAEKLHAEHEFGAKYPDMVSVYSIGPKNASEGDPHHTEAFSIEFCGGPHVKNTSELSLAGSFKIQKEEASSQGIRRIKAVLS